MGRPGWGALFFGSGGLRLGNSQEVFHLVYHHRVVEFAHDLGLGHFGHLTAEGRGKLQFLDAVAAFHHAGRRGGIQPAPFAAHFQGGATGLFEEGKGGRIPVAQPGFLLEAAGKPVISNGISDRHPGVAKGKDQRLGKTVEAEETISGWKAVIASRSIRVL